MSSLPTQETKAATVRRMFDRISGRYDRMNRIMTFGMDVRWRKRVVKRLALRPTDVVLDVACGTGDFSRLAAMRSHQVIGLDYSRGMLEAGREAHGDIALVQGDALRLPFADGSVDAILCGFAFRNFESIPPALAEMARVLRPGGRIGVLEVDRPRSRAVRTGHDVYFNRVVPLVGGLLSDRQAYRYLPESASYLPPPREMRAMFVAAGLTDVRKERLMMGAIQTIYATKRR